MRLTKEHLDFARGRLWVLSGAGSAVRDDSAAIERHIAADLLAKFGARVSVVITTEGGRANVALRQPPTVQTIGDVTLVGHGGSAESMSHPNPGEVGDG